MRFPFRCLRIPKFNEMKQKRTCKPCHPNRNYGTPGDNTTFRSTDLDTAISNSQYRSNNMYYNSISTIRCRDTRTPTFQHCHSILPQTSIQAETSAEYRDGNRSHNDNYFPISKVRAFLNDRQPLFGKLLTPSDFYCQHF